MKKYKTPIMRPVELKTAGIMAGSIVETKSVDFSGDNTEYTNDNPATQGWNNRNAWSN